MNPIRLNTTHSYPNQPITPSNTASSPVPRNGPTAPERKPDAEIIRQGLNNTPSIMQNPRNAVLHLLGIAKRYPNRSFNIDSILRLLAQIQDDERLGTKEDFILKNIIDDESLNPDFRLRLGAKANLNLINQAPEDQKLELYEAFASDSKFPLDLRIRELCTQVDTHQKTGLCSIFIQPFKNLLSDILNDADDFYNSNAGDYLEQVMKEFENNGWIQTPELQDLIKCGIESETEKILNTADSEYNAGYPIIQSCIPYCHGKLDRERVAQVIACAIKSATDCQLLEVELSICKKIGLIGENPIQELLVQIAMNQCESDDRNVSAMLLAITYIQNSEKRIQILNDMFAGELREVMFEDLKHLLSVLKEGLNELDQQELSTILWGISQSIDAMLNSKEPMIWRKQLKAIYRILKLLYKNIDDPKVHLSSIQNIIFNTKRESFLNDGNESIYTAYLDIHYINCPDAFVEAFYEVLLDTNIEKSYSYEVLLDTNIEKSYRKEIQDLYNESKESQEERFTYSYEKRLLEYYCEIIDSYYDCLLDDIAGAETLQCLMQVRKYYTMSSYINKHLPEHFSDKITKVLRTNP